VAKVVINYSSHSLCKNAGWVCENHPDRPWQSEYANEWGDAGMPCWSCNVPDDGGAPRMPEGFKTEASKDGWRH